MVTMIVLFCFFVCAVTDVCIRRTSEVLISLTVLAILLVDDPSWWRIGFGVLLALPWLVGYIKKQAGLGDVEMSFLLGFGFGFLGLFAMLVALILALLSRPWWKYLSTRWTHPEERKLAPVGFYYFLGSAVVVAVQHSIIWKGVFL